MDSDGGGRGRVVVGVLADPGLPSEVVSGMVEDLPGMLDHGIGGSVEWRVDFRTQPLVLDEYGNVPITKLAERLRDRYGWDILLLVTDLPRRVGRDPILADVNLEHRVVLASLPAVGGIRLRRRLRDSLAYLLGELGRAGVLPEEVSPRRPKAGTAISPVRWVDEPGDGIDASLSLVGVRGRLRLLLGMVRDNRPWRLVPELSTALAAASAAAAFGVFYGSIWSLADALSPARLAAISVLAVAAMVTWLIVYNNLWQRGDVKGFREDTVLYNVATVVTLAFGVGCAYVVLFVVTFAGASTVIPSDYLASMVGHPVNTATYLALAWLASSMGTFAGALGSSLESEDAVRRAAYSKRERERRDRYRMQEEQEEERQQHQRGDQAR